MSCCCCHCGKCLKWENFCSFSPSLSLCMSTTNDDFVANAADDADAAFPDRIRLNLSAGDSSSCCCVCRSAKLAEQPHIPPAATYQGGARQGADGQAEVLLHLQDIQATACLALQSVRQLRGSLRSPLSLGKCTCVYPPTPYVIYCPAVLCCWHWAAKPQMWAKSKRDREKELSLFCVFATKACPLALTLTQFRGKQPRAEVANFLAKNNFSKEWERKIEKEMERARVREPEALEGRQRIQCAI